MKLLCVWVLLLQASAPTFPKVPPGDVSLEPATTFRDCVEVGSGSNSGGFQSVRVYYRCKEGVLRVEGKWGIEWQGGRLYNTRLGALTGSDDYYVGDFESYAATVPWMKWCKSRFGYSLCGEK